MSSKTRLGAAACVLAAMAGPSCASKKSTAIVVAVTSEASVPKEIDGFEIEVQRGDSTPFFHVYTLAAQNEDARLPGTITLQNRDGEDSSQAATVIIRARLGDKSRVLRQATLGFADQKTKLLKMPLRYSCTDFPTECPSGTSCRGGACTADAVDVETLPDFSSELVFGVQGSATCFDDRTTVCLQSLTEVDTKALAATTDCTMTVPGAASAASRLNVAVHWKAATDAERLTVLDLDRQEGWSYTASKDGFSLAPGLCAALKSGGVLRVVYSTQCAPKDLAMPICQPPAGADTGAGGGSGVGGASGAGGAGGKTAVGTSCAAQVGSCNIAGKLFCSEYYGAAHLPSAQTSCTQNGGVWSAKACPTTTPGFVGTCPTPCTNVGQIIGFYYNGDASVAQTTCQNAGDTWVPATSGTGGAGGGG